MNRMRKFDWFMIGFILLGSGYTIAERLEAEKIFRQNYFLKCINMIDMPLGACSKLFGEK